MNAKMARCKGKRIEIKLKFSFLTVYYFIIIFYYFYYRSNHAK